jgi:hypothetical protein
MAGAEQYDLEDDASSAVFSIRKIVKLLKYSPARNSLLQQGIIKSEKMELQDFWTVKHAGIHYKE